MNAKTPKDKASKRDKTPFSRPRPPMPARRQFVPTQGSSMGDPMGDAGDGADRPSAPARRSARVEC